MIKTLHCILEIFLCVRHSSVWFLVKHWNRSNFFPPLSVYEWTLLHHPLSYIVIQSHILFPVTPHFPSHPINLSFNVTSLFLDYCLLRNASLRTARLVIHHVICPLWEFVCGRCQVMWRSVCPFSYFKWLHNS